MIAKKYILSAYILLLGNICYASQIPPVVVVGPQSDIEKSLMALIHSTDGTGRAKSIEAILNQVAIPTAQILVTALPYISEELLEKLLLKLSPKERPNLLNQRTHGGTNSMLQAAFLSARPEILRILLNHGANPNAVDSRGRTALHQLYDISLGNPLPIRAYLDMLDLLIQHGALLNITDTRSPMNVVARARAYYDNILETQARTESLLHDDQRRVLSVLVPRLEQLLYWQNRELPKLEQERKDIVSKILKSNPDLPLDVINIIEQYQMAENTLPAHNPQTLRALNAALASVDNLSTTTAPNITSSSTSSSSSSSTGPFPGGQYVAPTLSFPAAASASSIYHSS